MSQEFAPKAPAVVPTESMVRPHVVLEGKFEMYQDIARKRYNEAVRIAENIDDRVQSSIPYNKNAVLAAVLTAISCARAGQISQSL